MNYLRENLKKQKDDFKKILEIFKKRDFSGDTGIVVKNSTYQFSSTLVAKLGSFIFTIIVARLLMPEMFGFYSLALSTILIFSAISELGVETTLVKFLSKEVNKSKGRIRSLIFYVGKIKLILIMLSSILILISAKYIAETFYGKPIFLALLAGICYVTFNQINGFFKAIIQASEDFSSIFKREIVFQISRLILVPLGVLFFIKKSLSSEFGLMIIILALSFSILISSIMMFFDIKKLYSKKLARKTSIDSNQKKKINKFILATSILVLSGTFFGNIDRVMLGVFVKPEFIGYYTVSFSLLGALASLTSFMAVVLLPTFSRMKGEKLKEGLKRALRITYVTSFILFILLIILSKQAIYIAYGSDYLDATSVLRALSLLVLILPSIAIYNSYYLSRGKPGKIAKILVLSTLINILLNYILISMFVSYGDIFALYGAAIATTASQLIYLLSLKAKPRFTKI